MRQAARKKSVCRSYPFIDIVKYGALETTTGSVIPFRADTFCLPSDTPGADDIARELTAALQREA
jgi:lactam utilization protein B